MIDFLNHLDTDLFLFFNSLHNGFFDTIMYYISGKFTWLPLYLLIIYLIIKKCRQRAVLPILFIILLVVATDQASVQLFKNVFQRLRPCHNEEIKNLVHLVNNHCGGKFGFVSSHAANTFGVAVFVSLLFQKRCYSVGLLVWAFIVAYSRVYLGVHYLGDIICGGLLGSAIAIIVYKIYHKSSSFLMKENNN